MVRKEIEVNEKTYETNTVTVDLPIYRDHYGTTRINEHGTAITVQVDDDARRKDTEYSIKIRENYDFTEGSGREYHLGEGIYTGSRKRFIAQLEQIEEAVKRVREELDD